MRFTPISLLLLALAVPEIVQGDFEDDLEAIWRGTSVLTQIDTRSACSGFFTDNEVSGRVAAGGGAHHFSAGELGRVTQVDLHRRSIDLHIIFDEPLLVAYTEGPFTLYREATCKVELEVSLERAWVQRKDLEVIEQRLAELLDRFDSRADATQSDQWNRRARDPYPANYEQTLVDHEYWLVEQTNLGVQDRLDDAIDHLVRLSDFIEGNPAYLDGFYAGVIEVRGRYFPDCDGLVSRSVTLEKRSPPSEHSNDAYDWKEGFRDGQEHAHELEMLRRLPGCFVGPG